MTPGPGHLVPTDAQAIIASVRRSPANSTKKLLDALRPLQDFGLTEQESIGAGFGRFPVAGLATFVHDWLYPRFTPTFHLHEGTDIFAPFGAPVRSPAEGVLKQSEGAVGGLAAYVYQPDGTYYYLAHLSGFPPGQMSGQQVKVGDIVGYNGDSGNARGGSPHVHFEIHPAPTKTVTTGKGKNKVTKTVVMPVPVGTQLPPIDPKPYLDYWLTDAMDRVPRLIAALESSRPRAVVATGLTRRSADGRGGVFAAPTGPSRTQLLWASSASPGGGALRLAEAEAKAAAARVDWRARTLRHQLEREEARRMDALARTLLQPMTPVWLRNLFGPLPRSG